MQRTTTPKIFIFDGDGVLEESVSDTQELFVATSDASNSHFDIKRSAFDENFAGLMDQKENVTFVIPGGSTGRISQGLFATEVNSSNSYLNNSLKSNTISQQWKNGANVVGFGAGGGLVASKIQFYNTNFTNGSGMHVHQYVMDNQFAFNFFPQFIARGAYRPFKYSNSELNSKQNTGYCVDVKFNSNNKTLPQLYALGYGFTPLNHPISVISNKCESVAEYVSKQSFQINNQSENIVLSASIRRQRKEQDVPSHGNIFATGFNFEASAVKNSRVLGLFKFSQSIPQGNGFLPEYDHEKLIKNQAENQKQAVGLLQETLGLKR